MGKSRKRKDRPGARGRPRRPVSLAPAAAIAIAIAIAVALVVAIVDRAPDPEIPSPDTSAMEPQVAEKIAATRAHVAENARSPEAWGTLGKVFQAHGLLSEAAASYAVAQELDGEDFRWPYLRAQSLKDDRQHEPARAALDEALERKADYAPLHVLRAELHELEGEPTEALEAWEFALAIDETCAVAHLGVGRLELARGNVEESLSHLERARDLEPEAGAVRATLARAYGRIGNRERALEHAEAARAASAEVPLDDPVMASVAREAVSVVGLQDRALEAERRGEPLRAEALLRRMVELRPDEVNLVYNLANNLARQERMEEAEPLYREVLEREPEHASALINLGILLSQRGELDEAVSLFDRALEVAPDHPGALESRGKAAAAAGDVEGAIAWLEQSLERDPRRVEANALLGRMYGVSGRGEEAVAALERALALAPDRGDLHFELAVALAQRGSFEAAWEQTQLAEKKGFVAPEDFVSALRTRLQDF